MVVVLITSRAPFQHSHYSVQQKITHFPLTFTRLLRVVPRRAVTVHRVRGGIITEPVADVTRVRRRAAVERCAIGRCGVHQLPEWITASV